jgi:3',5'-cyclic AMP phosphodiesterase CpdA
VRALGSDSAVLWSSAPAWELEIATTEAMTVTLEVRNAMPNAELTSTDPDTIVEPLAGAIGTYKHFRLEFPAGTTRLAFGPPEAAEIGAFRFALMSDVQEAIDHVQDIFRTVNAEPGVEFLLGAGDLTEQGSHEELQRYQHELETLRVPYYTTLGNHELGPSPSLYQEYFGRGNFQFDYRGVTFTLLDSASATIDPLVYDWLEGWLDRARDRVHIVAMHIPPLDPTGVRNGAFGSRAEAAKLLGRLAEGGVDLTLYGHVHSYYAFDNAGIPAFISGGGGAYPEKFDDMGRHFMVIDVAPESGVQSTRVVRVYPEEP